MSDRKDFHYRQRVTEAELDGAFNDLEVADHNLAIDYGLTGLTTGLVAGQHTPNNLSADVSAGTAYDQAGQRIRVPSVQTVDLSVDNGGVTTSVTTPGNSKVVSLFVKFKRVLSDPRIDGNSDTVYFVRAEGFEFFVKQGTEAATGSEVAPALESDKLLIADVRRTQGVTAILNAHFNPYASNRRQDTFVVAGSPFVIRQGTIRGAISDVIGIANGVATDIATEATARASGDTAAISTAESFATSAIATALGTAQAYTDAETARATAEEAALLSDISSGDATALGTAQAYTDAETLRAEAAEVLLIPLAQRAAANGVATLDGTTKVPKAQLPMALISLQSVTLQAAHGGNFSTASFSYVDVTSFSISVASCAAGDVLDISAILAAQTNNTSLGNMRVVVVDPGVLVVGPEGVANASSSGGVVQNLGGLWTVVTPGTIVVKVQLVGNGTGSPTSTMFASAYLNVRHYRP